MQIMTAKKKTIRTLLFYVHVVLNGVIFPQISYDIVLYARQLPSPTSHLPSQLVE